MRPEKDSVKILMVDDDAANLLALEGILEPLGQPLMKAQSGTEALRCLLEHDFAVILLDVRMPDMNGFEAAAMIRSRPRSRSTPIIFLTGTEKSNDAMFEGYSAGAVDYLMKPAAPTVLRSKVEVFIELAATRLRLERQLQEREATARELERLNRLLADGNEKLAAANQELDAFCAAVSHDLRTPLSQMMGFAQLLDMTAAHKLNETEQKYLQRVRTVGESMNEMVSDFLTFARLGSLPLQPLAIDMTALVQEVSTQQQDVARTGGPAIEWDIQPLPAALGDAHMLRHAWVNLISNAIKYSRHRNPIRIQIRGECVDSEARYAITDNGVGFDASQAHRLFTAFSRLHPQSDFEGIGIGLSSVRRVVLKHGGRVWAEGQPDAGATFHMALPMP